MRLKTYIACLLFLTAFSLRAQQTTGFTLTRTILAELADFTVDNLGNIYLLSKDNQLKKLSPEGDSLAVFNDVRRYGKITSIDATNPLKVLVYYREFTTILALDRYLNKVNIIDLRKLGILQAKAVGLAYDNNIWVYDELDAKLKRIGDDGSLVDQTTDFRQLFDSVPNPAVIRDQGGLVYLYDPAKGVYAFDHYGGLKEHSALTGWIDFTVIERNLLGRNRQKFFKYQVGTLDYHEEPIPPAFRDAIKIVMTSGSFYVQKEKTLEVYSRR